MTHDELLAGIEEHSLYAYGNVGAALRAVVELHKGYGDMTCLTCEAFEQPCPTIQAIEKELS